MCLHLTVKGYANQDPIFAVLQGEVTASKLASYGSLEEVAKHHWSAILFVTRKMTSLGLDALFKAAPCLKTWRAATLMGYGGSLGASSHTNKASITH